MSGIQICLFLILPSVLVVWWVTVNVKCWRDLYRKDERQYPWNWRVLFGPWMYFRWLDSK